MSACKHCNRPKSEHLINTNDVGGVYLICPTSVYEEAPQPEIETGPWCKFCGGEEHFAIHQDEDYPSTLRHAFEEGPRCVWVDPLDGTACDRTEFEGQGHNVRHGCHAFEAPKEENLTSQYNALGDCYCVCGTKMELRSTDVPGRAGPLMNYVCPKCFPWPVAEKPRIEVGDIISLAEDDESYGFQKGDIFRVQSIEEPIRRWLYAAPLGRILPFLAQDVVIVEKAPKDGEK